jgi:hypothetical protein
MALCINQAGTYRNIITLCINQAGTYRNILTGCINQAGTYRLFGFIPELGDSYEGGFLICKASPLRWVVSPYSAEVSRTWFLRNDANTTAQSVSGCTGWFVPTISQLQNPGYCCRSFWGPAPCYSSMYYWSSTCYYFIPSYGCYVRFQHGGSAFRRHGSTTLCVRAFRCVTY